MTWGETGEFDGVQITCMPAQHGSARLPFDRDETLWCSWMLERAGVKAIFLGDTGYAPFFAGIGSRFGPFDLAMIPIGAYRPFWFMKPLHMQPAESVCVHNELRSKLSIAMHWGTFALADEPIAEPPLLFAEALAAQGVSIQQFRLPRLGETIQG
jgi:N-acyl-phosphatidylethanolamine-hydrolysing phospholipase D